MLSITPRIVRNLPYQSPYDMEFPSGTESSMRMPAVRGPIEALGVELPEAPAVVVTPTPISGRP
ncbi:hypothetical protein D9M69_545300 [compost metagenome]